MKTNKRTVKKKRVIITGLVSYSFESIYSSLRYVYCDIIGLYKVNRRPSLLYNGHSEDRSGNQYGISSAIRGAVDACLIYKTNEG